ncbi:MAG: hypothetical protein K2Q20_11275, partial [Phycisphaerales bacterium]|nr:hypothetical protein [Phycisphaerales bacterium]
AGDGVRVMQVFGLRQSAGADNWVETGPGFATWRSVPGLTGTAQHADLASWTYLGQMVVDNAGFGLNTQPDGLWFRSQALLDWLRTDTDARVTLLIKRATPSTEGTPLFTKESDPTRAPALKLRLRCRADINADGARDVSDIFSFLSLWFAGCTTPGTPACGGLDASADVNADGLRDVSDIFSFLSLWFAGC